MTIRSRRNRISGMLSLLEVVLATVLFSTMVMALANIWALHSRIINGARNKLMAVYVGQGLIEDCIARGYGNEPLTPPTGSVVNVTSRMHGQSVTTSFTYFITRDKYSLNFGAINVYGMVEQVDVTVYYPDDHSSKLQKLIDETILVNAL